MKSKALVFARKSDFLILIVLFLTSILLCLIPYRNRGTRAQIILDQKIIAEIPLSQPEEAFTLTAAPEYQFTVSDGKISIIAAPCRNQLCVHSGAAGSVGQRIICLPNRLMIVIVGNDDKAIPDAVL